MRKASALPEDDVEAKRARPLHGLDVQSRSAPHGSASVSPDSGRPLPERPRRLAEASGAAPRIGVAFGFVACCTGLGGDVTTAIRTHDKALRFVLWEEDRVLQHDGRLAQVLDEEAS